MRDIKFRAILKNPNPIAHLLHSKDDLGNFFDHLIYPNEDYHIMQFTGLQDKNGVGIYEGDVMGHPEFPLGELKVTIESGCTLIGGWDCVRTDLTEGWITGNIHQTKKKRK